MSGICIGAPHDCFLNPPPAHSCWISDVYFPSLQRLSPHPQTVLTIHAQHDIDLVFPPISQWKHIILLRLCIVMTCFNLHVPQVSAADLFGPRGGSEPVHRPGLLHAEGRRQTPAAVPHLRWSPAHSGWLQLRWVTSGWGLNWWFMPVKWFVKKRKWLTRDPKWIICFGY